VKYVILALCLMAFLGCASEYTRVDSEAGMLHLKGENTRYRIHTFVYDGCEYVAFGSGHDMSVTHKGNCKQCAERAKETKK
jgi:hypothetical protein